MARPLAFTTGTCVNVQRSLAAEAPDGGEDVTAV